VLNQKHRPITHSRRTSPPTRGARRHPRQARRTSHRGVGGRGSRFETTAAQGVVGPRGRVRTHDWPRTGQGQRARNGRARYRQAASKRGLFAGASPAAVGRAAFNIAVLSLLGWVLVWFFASDQFYVSQIVVTGNSRLSAEMIRQVSGLQGYSSFWIDPRRTAARVMESLPPITSVQVRHGLSNTVTLLVKEHEEQIMWQVSGVRYWVDEAGHLRPAQNEGEVLAPEWTPTSEWTLLVNDLRPNPPADALSPGALSVDPDALVAAHQIVHLLPEVRVIEYAPATGLRFLHPRGWLVYLGTGSDMARKVNVLRAIEVQFAGKDVLQPTLIDLRYPDSPYYRLPGDALPGSGGD
jgi:hypothetical protein